MLNVKALTIIKRIFLGALTMLISLEMFLMFNEECHYYGHFIPKLLISFSAAVGYFLIGSILLFSGKNVNKKYDKLIINFAVASLLVIFYVAIMNGANSLDNFLSWPSLALMGTLAFAGPSEAMLIFLGYVLAVTLFLFVIEKIYSAVKTKLKV